MNDRRKKVISFLGLGIFVILAAGSMENKDSSSKNVSQTHQSNEQAEIKKDWVLNQAPEIKMSFYMPSQVLKQSAPLTLEGIKDQMTLNSYYSKDSKSGVEYYLTHVEYPKAVDVSQPIMNLRGAVDGMKQQTPGSVLISSNEAKFLGNPAIEFLFDLSDQNTLMKGVVLLKGHEIVQIFVAYEKGKTFIESDYRYFMNNIKFTN